MDEAAVLEKIRQGQSEAFKDLVEKYNEQALRVAFRYLHNWEEAADCVQESFLRAFENLHTKHRHKKFSSWFFQILVNCCLDELRSAHKRLNVFFEDNESVLSQEGFEERANSRLTAQQLLAKMPPEMRSLLILHDLEGFSFRELAEILDRSEAAVRGLLFRARKKLAKIYRELEK